MKKNNIDLHSNSELTSNFCPYPSLSLREKLREGKDEIWGKHSIFFSKTPWEIDYKGLDNKSKFYDFSIQHRNAKMRLFT